MDSQLKSLLVKTIAEGQKESSISAKAKSVERFHLMELI